MNAIIKAYFHTILNNKIIERCTFLFPKNTLFANFQKYCNLGYFVYMNLRVLIIQNHNKNEWIPFCIVIFWPKWYKAHPQKFVQVPSIQLLNGLKRKNFTTEIEHDKAKYQNLFIVSLWLIFWCRINAQKKSDMLWSYSNLLTKETRNKCPKIWHGLIITVPRKHWNTGKIPRSASLPSMFLEWVYPKDHKKAHKKMFWQENTIVCTKRAFERDILNIIMCKVLIFCVEKFKVKMFALLINI